MPEVQHVAPAVAGYYQVDDAHLASRAVVTAPESCWERAASLHGVNVQVIQAIASVESNYRARAINRNRNGSADLGIMQINSSWLPTLRRYGISRSDLFDPCINIHVGAWILSQNVRRFGATSWRAVGAYNAAADAKRLAYALKVHRRLAQLQH